MSRPVRDETAIPLAKIEPAAGDQGHVAKYVLPPEVAEEILGVTPGYLLRGGSTPRCVFRPLPNARQRWDRPSQLAADLSLRLGRMVLILGAQNDRWGGEGWLWLEIRLTFSEGCRADIPDHLGLSWEAEIR